MTHDNNDVKDIDMIYLKLKGRIGNQLFMYAVARQIQYLKGNNDEIIIEDEDNSLNQYVNSLREYKLENVIFLDHASDWYKRRFFVQRCLIRWDERCIRGRDYNQSYKFEKRWQLLYNLFGLFRFRDGYVKYPRIFRKDVLVDGYFQSEKFFPDVKEEIGQIYRLEEQVENSGYPNLKLIQKRNTVCISIKVQHNAGNPMFDVCHEDYYTRAIQYIQENVENPLFFVCSDNVEYVKEHLIDTSKYDVIEQDMSYPVHVSLAVMAQCKHFIIGNSSFAWWAQYLSTYDNKIVVAPSKWYGIPADWQWDIYQDNWVLIDV